MKSQQQTQQTPETTITGTTIKGDVLKMEGEFYTIRNTAGHDVRVHVDKSTKLDRSMPFIIGDEVEAQVTAQGHALSIKHASAPDGGIAALGPQAIKGDVLKIEGEPIRCMIRPATECVFMSTSVRSSTAPYRSWSGTRLMLG